MAGPRLCRERLGGLELGGDDPVGRAGGFNYSFGLMFDPARGLVWAVGQYSHVHVLRVDPKSLKTMALRQSQRRSVMGRSSLAVVLTSIAAAAADPPKHGATANADNVPYIGKREPNGNPVRLAIRWSLMV